MEQSGTKNRGVVNYDETSSGVKETGKKIFGVFCVFVIEIFLCLRFFTTKCDNVRQGNHSFCKFLHTEYDKMCTLVPTLFHIFNSLSGLLCGNISMLARIL